MRNNINPESLPPELIAKASNWMIDLKKEIKRQKSLLPGKYYKYQRQYEAVIFASLKKDDVIKFTPHPNAIRFMVLAIESVGTGQLLLKLSKINTNKPIPDYRVSDSQTVWRQNFQNID